MQSEVKVLVSVGFMMVQLNLYTAVILSGDQSIQKRDAAIRFRLISKRDTPSGIYTTEVLC